MFLKKEKKKKFHSESLLSQETPPRKYANMKVDGITHTHTHTSPSKAIAANWHRAVKIGVFCAK